MPATLPAASTRPHQRPVDPVPATPAAARPAGPDRGVFSVTDGHEQVVFCQDEASGLRAIIAVHSTVLGPALGGTRCYPYPDEQAALADVLALSRGMTYKAAVTGLDLGGGKAVILGDPAQVKTREALLAYGRFVQSLGGRYYTACDVGTFSADMDVVDEVCDYVTGRSPARGGAGDSSVLTAYGVLQGMRAAAEATWGSGSLRGRHVGVAGVGKVGRHLVRHLVEEEGARVTVCDVSADAVSAVRRAHPDVAVADSTESLVRADLDVYAPCALGGALDDDTVAALQAEVVCGAANNQLAHDGIGEALAARGIRYAPDYLVNAGGLIQVEDELHGFDFARAKGKAEEIRARTLEVFDRAASDGVPTAVAADRLAEQRIAARRASGAQSRAGRSA